MKTHICPTAAASAHFSSTNAHQLLHAALVCCSHLAGAGSYAMHCACVCYVILGVGLQMNTGRHAPVKGHMCATAAGQLTAQPPSCVQLLGQLLCTVLMSVLKLYNHENHYNNMQLPRAPCALSCASVVVQSAQQPSKTSSYTPSHFLTRVLPLCTSQRECMMLSFVNRCPCLVRLAPVQPLAAQHRHNPAASKQAICAPRML